MLTKTVPRRRIAAGGDVTPTDDELIAAALAGDLEAFDVLMRRYERLAFKVAHGFAGTREGALDIVQGAFLSAVRSLGEFGARSSFKTWLVRIVLNEGLDWRRARGRREARHAPLDGASSRASDEPGPEEVALRREERARLARALERLGGRARLAVTLRYFDELSIPEIATVLDCSEATTRNALFRGLRRLRSALGVRAEGKTDEHV
jgi:RNA polymerase sigma-70 factor (ECF subfamily)